MKHIWLAAALCLCLIAAGANADFSTFSKETAIEGNPRITETVWRAVVPPEGDYDRIGLHRFQDTSGKAKAVMLYLPGTNMNGELAVLDEDHNLWLYLAARGIKVYTLDYRTHFVPNDPVPDLGFMKAWNIESFVDDGVRALDHIRKTEAGLPIFVAGFSRGVTYAYILAEREPLAGLVVLDGGFKSYKQEDFGRLKAMTMLRLSGEYGSVLSRSRGWDKRTEMMRRAAENPDGPAMGKFDSIGDQVASTLYNAWGPGALANPVDGISSVRVLAQAMAGYDRCFPVIQNIEGKSIAVKADDPATDLDDGFGDMTLPVIYFGSTNMGADSLLSGIYSAAKSGSKDVTINVLENYGHVDVLFGDRAKDDVYAVIQRWMGKHI